MTWVISEILCSCFIVSPNHSSGGNSHSRIGTGMAPFKVSKEILIEVTRKESPSLAMQHRAGRPRQSCTSHPLRRVSWSCPELGYQHLWTVWAGQCVGTAAEAVVKSGVAPATGTSQPLMSSSLGNVPSILVWFRQVSAVDDMFHLLAVQSQDYPFVVNSSKDLFPLESTAS